MSGDSPTELFQEANDARFARDLIALSRDTAKTEALRAFSPLVQERLNALALSIEREINYDAPLRAIVATDETTEPLVWTDPNANPPTARLSFLLSEPGIIVAMTGQVVGVQFRDNVNFELGAQATGSSLDLVKSYVRMQSASQLFQSQNQDEPFTPLSGIVGKAGLPGSFTLLPGMAQGTNLVMPLRPTCNIVQSVAYVSVQLHMLLPVFI